LRPESRGHVHIASSDHRDAPVVTPNFLDTPDDIRTVVDAMRLIGRIGRSPILAQFGAREVVPDLAEETDEALLDYVRANATAAFHSAGSCRMGSDAMAVVDPQLRVRGISGLRVADASIMPTMPSGALNAICIMIGEKCADMIKTASAQQ
jgi:choline dehydrogenase